MREIPTGDPAPPGVSGSLEHINQCIANAGIAGAVAGPQTMNPIGQMPLYGSSLAARSRLGGSNLGGQNRGPVGFPSEGSFFLAAALSAPCPCSPSHGGTFSQGPGGYGDSMNPCDLNAAICQLFFPPPNPRPKRCSTKQ
ncbi:MAG: hypothetical protein KIS61_29475 [Candidatus Eremiobacteraeota bacterium]|nr:hypothetical protein [Candidatus Eremiobacteraeota bacterium]